MYARIGEAYRVPEFMNGYSGATRGFPINDNQPSGNIKCNRYSGITNNHKTSKDINPSGTGSYGCQSSMTGSCQTIDKNICCSSGSPPDFNTQYHVNGLPPYRPYPSLHPIEDIETDEEWDPDHNIDSTLMKDPHQGAGWIRQRELCTKTDSTRKLSNEGSEETSELLRRVLANKYCRKILRQIFSVENDSEQSGGKVEETSKSIFNSDTIKTIIMYCLGGLILLCFFDLLIKIGRLLK